MISAEAPSPEPKRRNSRTTLWLGVGLVLTIAVLVALRRGRNTGASSGATIDANLTLITSDRTDLACASSKTLDPYACGFADDATPRRIDERNILRPYMTEDRHLLLIPGLFLQTSIAKRYESEPPHVPREQLKRFTAKCKLKKAGQLERFKLRWVEKSAWSEPQNADVLTVVSCDVAG
jgi:hypothetical protein